MPDVINEYQKWKQQGEDLRVQAKHAMETRFRELLTEAVRIAEEYRSDFGAALKPPPAVTAFRYKATAKAKRKKPAAKAAGEGGPREVRGCVPGAGCSGGEGESEDRRTAEEIGHG